MYKLIQVSYIDVLINIRKILRSLNLESKKVQKEYGLSIPQLLCLGFLSDKQDYKATHGEIARYLNLNSSTVTGIVNRLEAKGYVARLPHLSDKRAVFISLTSKGDKLLEESPELLHELLSRKLKRLPEEKLDQINEALKILIDSLEIEDISASPVITVEEPLSPPDKNH